MTRLLKKVLQGTGTALAFGLFGIAGIVFGLLVSPFLGLFASNTAERERAARRVVRLWFACFIRIIEGLGLVRVVLLNPERLERPGIIVAANHPSLIDVVALISRMDNAAVIVKDKLTRSPFTRAPIRAAGYVSNALGAAGLERATAALESGAAFVLCPEGTRTPASLPAGKSPRMHRGAAALALASRRPITPVRIHAEPRWLTKDRGWWHLPEKPMTLTLEVLPDIDSADLLDRYNERPSAAVRALSKRLARALFPHLEEIDHEPPAH